MCLRNTSNRVFFLHKPKISNDVFSRSKYENSKNNITNKISKITGEIDMREITVSELKLVSGGSVADAAAIGGALGGAAGVSYAAGMGASGTAVAGMAGIAAAAGAGLGVAAAGGWAAGQWINANTPIQQAISDILPDPTGLTYCGGGY